MTALRDLVDWHAHMLSPRLVPPDGAAGAWPGIEREGSAFRLTLGGRPYRPVDARTFEAGPRLAEMDRLRVAVQVLSPPPYAVAFDGPAEERAALAEQQNAFLAETVAAHPGRFAMLGMLPFGEPDLVDAELDRLERLPEVAGVCLIAHRDDGLCEPALAKLWTRVADNHWVAFVHPADTALCECDLSTGAVFGTAMPLVTARTATRMITSGLFAAVPELQVLLAHAGGALGAIIDRFEHGWRLGQHPALPEPPLRYARRNFWFDSMVYAPAPLRLVTETFGAERLVYGSDYPFTAMLTPEQFAEIATGTGAFEHALGNGRALLDRATGSAG